MKIIKYSVFPLHPTFILHDYGSLGNLFCHNISLEAYFVSWRSREFNHFFFKNYQNNPLHRFFRKKECLFNLYSREINLYILLLRVLEFLPFGNCVSQKWQIIVLLHVSILKGQYVMSNTHSAVNTTR